MGHAAPLTALRVSLVATAIAGVALFAGMSSDPAAAVGPFAVAACGEGEATVRGLVRQGEGSVAPAETCLSKPATVMLTATPAHGWRFAAWKGDCNDTGGNRCWINATPPGSFAAYAYFERLPDTPPSIPGDLRVTTTQPTNVGLAWSASTDDLGVAGYDLFVNGEHVATISATDNLFANLACGTSYTFGVRARDTSGNVSDTATITASTAACGDTTPPSPPSALTVGEATRSSLAVSWTAASDNVGVSGYDVFVDGAAAGAVSATQHTFAGLACGRSYALGVRARDGAGNVSPIVSVSGSTVKCEEPAPTIGEVGEPPGRDQPAAPNRDLVVSVGGTGTGTVRSRLLGRALQSSGDTVVSRRIVCGAAGFQCFTETAPGARVSLTATAAKGSRFLGWTGPCVGAGRTCTLSLRSSKVVKALFKARKASSVAVALTRPRVRIRWNASVGQGSLVVSGRVNRPAILRVQLRRPGGGPLLTQVAPVLAGSFRLSPKLAAGLLPPGALVLPGGFVVSVKGRSGRNPIPLQIQTVVLPAPPEGVVRRSFASPGEDRPASLALPAGTKEAWANFVFAAQPRAGQRLTVRWYLPDGRLLGEVAKANREQVSSFLRSDSGIPSGLWRAELRTGGKLVKALSVRVG